MIEKYYFSALNTSDQNNKESYDHANQNAKNIFVFTNIFNQTSKVRYGHAQTIEKHFFQFKFFVF